MKERYGSARLSGAADLARAGMFTQRPESLFCGYFGGKPLWYHYPAGAVFCGGARSGKLAHFFGCCTYAGYAF